MKQSTLTGIVAGAAVVTAGLAFASFRILESDVQFAEVLAVQPVLESVKKPREECPDELTVRASPSNDSQGARAAVFAATLPPKDRHERASDKVQEAKGPNHRCRTVYDDILETVAYDVVYRLGKRQGTIRMDHDPGRRILVRDGELVLAPNFPDPPSDPG